MSVEFRGPNPNFTKMKKDGGDVKVDGMKETHLESVNRDDFEGRERKPKINPGADSQSRTVHGKQPFTEGALSGMEQPKMGLQDEKISGDKKINEPPRGFKYNREGHKIENGGSMEGQGGKY